MNCLISFLLIVLSLVSLGAARNGASASPSTNVGSVHTHGTILGSPDGTCGPGNGNTCDNSTNSLDGCCSQFGWCGHTEDYCLIENGCQPEYGNCTELDNPDYSKLISLKRYRLGKIPYGEPIYGCRSTGQIALTFDDGPYHYTKRLLDILKAAGVNATFFITGANLGKGSIDDPALPWKSLIRRMYREGHQVAAHTWTHPDLESLSESGRRNQMHRLEYAFSKILGKIPTYMRPPYSRCEGACLDTMKDLGYHVIYFDLDTEDYSHILPSQIKDSIKIATDIIQAVDPKVSSILSIAHDIHPLSVIRLTVEMIKVIKDRGFEPVTVGKCLGDAPSHWYRQVIV
ncbi:hypothetical protein TWF506_009650 [Arthrobotrys conoides]|uniref:Chitin deacetylase n=1 Tax=Arthrobotrys conoides TaxID=74498 RepID=A0AAN8N2K5_9PEZI